MDLKEKLDDYIAQWAIIGHVPLMEAFVSRNGQPFSPVPWTKPRMKRHECFANASTLVMRDATLRYAEGYVWRAGLPLQIHHGWAVGPDGEAIDPTLERPEECQYFGVLFDRDTTYDELMKNGYYGLLDNPATMINLDLFKRLDAGFVEIIEHAMKGRK